MILPEEGLLFSQKLESVDSLKDAFCLQNFLYDYSLVPLTTHWGHSSRPVTRKESGISGGISGEKKEIRLAFDGLANTFPVGYFQRYTRLTHLQLRTHIVAEKVQIAIIHTPSKGHPHILAQETLTHWSGVWVSAGMPIGQLEGRLHLEIMAEGAFEIRDTAWFGSPMLINTPSFLISITAFGRDAYVQSLLESVCRYIPLKSFDLRFLVVDNAGTLSPEKLPVDPRILFITQENLGCTSGVMRALAEARRMKTDFMIIADDDIVLPPEMLYRMIVFQSLANQPVAVGAGMMTLRETDLLWEKGSRVLDTGLNTLQPLHKKTKLDDPASFTELFEDSLPDYTALWLMSAPTDKLSFLPAFFIYYEDVLQGLTLQKKGVRSVVPSHIFLWHATLEKRGSFWKRYLWVRNDMATRFLNPEKMRSFSIALSFLKIITQLVLCYDYQLAGFYIKAFREAISDASWTTDPLGQKQKVDQLIRQTPTPANLSDQLSENIRNPSSPLPFLLRLGKRIGYILTLGGYMNPFSRERNAEGKLAFRYHADYEAWGWFGYHTVAVIDTNGMGYVCRCSWKKALPLIFSALKLSVRFLITHQTMTKSYAEKSNAYEHSWIHAFQEIDRRIKKKSF